MRSKRIGTGANQQEAFFLEICREPLKRIDFSWADEGEVPRIPKEDEPLALETLAVNLYLPAFKVSQTFPGRHFFTYSNHQILQLILEDLRILSLFESEAQD